MFAEAYLVRINALPPDPDVSPPATLDALYNPTRHPDDTVDYLPLSEAGLPILDWGFLHGDATYDVVHIRKGPFFRLDAIPTGSSGTCAGRAVRPGLAVYQSRPPCPSTSLASSQDDLGRVLPVFVGDALNDAEVEKTALAMISPPMRLGMLWT